MSSDFASTVSMSLIELGEEDKPWLELRFISELNVSKSSTEPFAAAVTVSPTSRKEAYHKRRGGDRYCADANSYAFPPQTMMRLFKGGGRNQLDASKLWSRDER
ncbi:hypothetical protein B0H13DRAFT_1894008 [Mycena leptocephala]|nr:hypothetical protein B0H13DRAFT_1894008 [Mycena leptocephala]